MSILSKIIDILLIIWGIEIIVAILALIFI